MKNKKKELILVVLGILSLVLITVGVTYAFFNYAKEGTTENTLSTGTIEFLYTEVDKQGAGISIEDAYPISDSLGKAQTASNEVFNFKVTSKLVGEVDIPYEVTARKKATSTLDEDAVRIYLTEVIGDKENELLLDNYGSLTQSEKVTEDIAIEKTLYKGLVPTGSTSYEKNFRLRMWIDDSIKFTQNEDGTYPYNDKEFTITVNVYANAKVVTDSEIDYANTTEIESLTVNGTESVTDNENYDYYTEVTNETTEASINIETTNSSAKVEVTKSDGTVAYKSTGVKRLSTIQTVTVQLEEGDNIFNIKVTSANGQVENEYSLNIFRALSCAYAPGDIVKTFNYLGNVEEYIVPCNAIYKLEVYGAQGGSASSTYYGGKGGYSTGYIQLSDTQTLYVAVGGQGGVSANKTASGGYNGGGTGDGNSYTSEDTAAGGGGATHIATGTTNRGVLKNYKDYQSELLIVAGGGGGGYYDEQDYYGAGGAGGGTTGGVGRGKNTMAGGTQTSGYSFGQGGNPSSTGGVYGSGSGGGYYGGTAGNRSSGSGGSGYIGGVPEFTSNGTTYTPLTSNGQRSGHGYAQITLVSFK